MAAGSASCPDSRTLKALISWSPCSTATPTTPQSRTERSSMIARSTCAAGPARTRALGLAGRVGKPADRCSTAPRSRSGRRARARRLPCCVLHRGRFRCRVITPVQLVAIPHGHHAWKASSQSASWAAGSRPTVSCGASRTSTPPAPPTSPAQRRTRRPWSRAARGKPAPRIRAHGPDGPDQRGDPALGNHRRGVSVRPDRTRHDRTGPASRPRPDRRRPANAPSGSQAPRSPPPRTGLKRTVDGRHHQDPRSSRSGVASSLRPRCGRRSR